MKPTQMLGRVVRTLPGKCLCGHSRRDHEDDLVCDHMACGCIRYRERTTQDGTS